MILSSVKIPHFPFSKAPYKAQMGLTLLDLKDWLELDSEREAQTKLKSRLLIDHPDTVLGVTDEALARDAGLELHETVWAHLQKHFPEVKLRKTEPTSTREALKEIATWVQEDFCLLSPVDQTLMAGLVCFPSRWKLSDKMGKGSDGIHEPVKHFGPISRPTAGALKQLTKPLVRFNWTIHPSSELFTPHATHEVPQFDRAKILENTFLRVERQTLRKLPRSGAVVFTIRTYIHRLDEIVADPERKELLTATLHTLPRDIAEYRGMRHFFDDLKAALPGS